METIVFPLELTVFGGVTTIQFPHPLGNGAKVILNKVAQEKLPELYYQLIDCGGGFFSTDGQAIEVKTVGRWLFGLPGYRGHLNCFAWDSANVRLEFPYNSPDIIYQLVNKSKSLIEAADFDVADHSINVEVLESALDLIHFNRPRESIFKKAAFANTVQYLVSGIRGGFGGPTVRELVVKLLAAGNRYTYQEAVDWLFPVDSLIFGRLNDLHHTCFANESCEDDDPADLKELVKSKKG